MYKLPFIVNAIYNDDLTVTLNFSDNTCQSVNIGDFIKKHPHPQYNKYLKPSNFKKGRLENGNVIWGNDLEFPLEELYQGKIL